MSEFLQNLIPSSNRLEAAFASKSNNGRKAKLLQDQYDAGFVGAFVDDKSQDWPARAARYTSLNPRRLWRVSRSASRKSAAPPL